MKYLIWIAAVVAALALLIWYGSLEPVNWRRAQRRDSIEEYQKYVEQFPEGQHVNKANERLQELLDHPQMLTQFRESFEQYKTFDEAPPSTEQFKPPILIICDDWVGFEPFDSQHWLCKTLREAVTIAFVETHESDYGRWQDNRERKGYSATVCLVEKDDPSRRRVMKAYSTPPSRIVSRGSSILRVEGGDCKIDGEIREWSLDTDGRGQLVFALLERAIDRNESSVDHR